MALSKNTSKWLKYGVGAGALALGVCTPVGWALGLSGGAAVAADVIGGTVIGHYVDKGAHALNHEIDKNTVKGKHVDHKAKSDAPTTHSETDKGSKAPASAASSAQTKASSAASAAGTTQTSGTSAANADPITTILTSLLTGGSTNQNGQSVDATVDKFLNDSTSLQQQSQKNYQNELQQSGLATGTSAGKEAQLN